VDLIISNMCLLIVGASGFLGVVSREFFDEKKV